MKGLLLKDWYMMKRYCRMYLFIAIAFLAASFVNKENLFFTFYPCMLCGMIPVNLLAYDERSRWIGYSGTLPYTAAQIVSSKYLIGLFAQLAVLGVTGAVQGVKMYMGDGLSGGDFAVMMVGLLVIASISSSICLPFVFRLGVEKGRIAYYVMIGIVCASSILASQLFSGQIQIGGNLNALLTALVIGGICLHILSWYLSVVFYKKREV